MKHSEIAKEEGHEDQFQSIQPPAVKRTGGVALAVEDVMSNMFLLEHFLRKLGYSIIPAHNGEEAVQLVQKRAHEIDVILMDLKMPVCDGYEAMNRIDQLGPEFSEIPVIILTADADESVQNKCLERGIEDFLIKPFKIDTLRTALNRKIR